MNSFRLIEFSGKSFSVEISLLKDNLVASTLSSLECRRLKMNWIVGKFSFDVEFRINGIEKFFKSPRDIEYIFISSSS